MSARHQTSIGAPFFVVGSVRSGTTLLRLLLGHHPQICQCLEMEYVAPTAAASGLTPDLAEYHRELRVHRAFGATGYAVDESLSFVDLARSFLEQRQQQDGKPLVGATVHNHFDALETVWPGARYIFLNRDPRDVARSVVQMGWAGSAWHGAESWIRARDAWARVLDSVPPEQCLEVRFEDLVSDTETVLTQCCTFLGTTYDPAMLAIEDDTTYARPDPRGARSWRTSAAPREIAQVEARVGRARLEASGYEPSDTPELGNGALSRARIALENRVGQVRFRIRRYGLGLWSAGVISRRLPFRGWRDSVQARLGAVDAQHLK